MEVANMPVDEFRYWSKYIPILIGREQLQNLEANAYPNLKKDDAKKVRDRYYKQAVPLELDDSKVHTTDDLAIIFKGKMRGK